MNKIQEEIIAEYDEKYTGLAWHTNPNSKELGQFLLQSLQKVEDSAREEMMKNEGGKEQIAMLLWFFEQQILGKSALYATLNGYMYTQKAHDDILEDIKKVLEKHTKWNPTNSYESDEEKGYQKGLIAEAKLIQSEVLEIISKK